MTIYFGEKELVSDYGTVRIEFDINVRDGRHGRIRDAGYVPRFGNDQVNVRFDYKGQDGHYALLTQDGEAHAVQNGSRQFFNTNDEEGFALYLKAFPTIQKAILRSDQTIDKDLDAILNQGAGIDLRNLRDAA